MRQPLGYGARQQQQFDPLAIMKTVEIIKSLRQEQAVAEEQKKRAAQGDVNLAADRLRESQERIGQEASAEVFGARTGFEPYVEPTMRNLREGKPVPRPLIKTEGFDPSLRGGANVVDMPMGRADVVEGIKRARPRYQADVKKAEPTYQDIKPIEITPTTEGFEGATRYTEPAEQITERAKVFPIKPSEIGKEVEQQTRSSQEQLKLRGERADYPLARRETTAKTRYAEATATGAEAETKIREAQVRNLSIDEAIKTTQLASSALDLNIK